MSYTYFKHTTDPDAVLAEAHYSDPRFAGEGACIYGTPQGGQGEYTDRLAEWHVARLGAASAALVAAGLTTQTARGAACWLSALLDRPVEVVAIIAGARQDNGYAWYFYEYQAAPDAPARA